MPDNTQEIRSKLLTWYRKHARDLPWRHTRDPYKIWVSEIMLQQTQVQTVIPYYKHWCERFPGLKSLAEASQDDVMKYWAGLGYYRRVKMLHNAAQFVQTQLDGKIPSNVKELLEIPGIGRYTAGAIASIAFQKPAPIVDGNVIRILTRLYALKQNIAQRETLKHLWTLAEELVSPKHAGDFNQAMMELGATVCLPRNPSCSACPVRSECKSFAAGNPEKYPVKTLKEKIEKIKTAAFVLRNPSNQVLIRRQPETARWGGLWMFPFGDHRDQVAKQLKVSAAALKHSFIVKHGFTKYSIQLHVFEAGVNGRKSKALASPQSRWISVQELEAVALPSPHQKIANRLQENAHANQSA